ncbi:MAG: hypothetical protein FVQ82_00845 [Planctomycetes bacterium]|nr:hypothetical protein [Planctomycetota bacterium]
MITFLSSPKPFVGNAGRIQRNAICSWKAVHPDVEVIIYGDGEGVADVCSEMGLRHIPDIPCAPSGIPFFNGIVEHAAEHAKYDIQCYLNCDIILAGNIFDAVKNISFEKFLVTGQRIDLREGTPVDIAGENWQGELLDIIKADKADLHPPSGMDYFIFPRGMWKNLLPLVIGRGGYDSALVMYCFRNKIPFINATLSIPAFHQFHDYGHLKGGRKLVFDGEDARNNCGLHRNNHSTLNSADSTWLIIDGKLTERPLPRGVLRKIEHYLRFDLKLERISISFRLLWRIAGMVGLARNKQFTLKDIAESAFKS